MTTRSCNLKCRHCYSSSRDIDYEGELTTDEGLGLIADLASYGAPALLLSGGEPLRRGDIFDLLKAATDAGLRCTVSTNGTLIDQPVAKRLREAGVIYVGVSLDGVGDVHDQFRGVSGAFDSTLSGIRNLKAVGQKVGLRLTLTTRTFEQLDGIFDLIAEEEIDRACFYHLVPAGRGKIADDLTPAQRLDVLDLLVEKTLWLAERRPESEVLAVGNPSDAAFIHRWLLNHDPDRASEVYELLEWNGGAAASSGIGLGAVDSVGDVHADQFWQHYTIGNVRDRPFSEIWSDASDPLLARLRSDDRPLPPECRSCEYMSICGGGMRVRAEMIAGEVGAADPSCFLLESVG